MTVIYNMSIDRADKPWIGDRRLTEIARAGNKGPAGQLGSRTHVSAFLPAN